MALIERNRQVSSTTVYNYLVRPAQEGKLSLLYLHGFPSCAQDWTSQAQYFAARGYGVLVPDLLGYEGTWKPTSASAYNWVDMSKQIEALLDHENISHAIGIGHDLGSWFLSRLVHLLLERVSAVAFLDVGYVAPGEEFDVGKINEVTKQMTGEEKFCYWYHFTADDEVSLLDQHHESILSLMHADPETMAANLGPHTKAREGVEQGRIMSTMHWGDEYTKISEERSEAFARGGWTGPLNWYKANISWADEQHMEKDLSLPVLLIGCGKDEMTPATSQDHMTREYSRGITDMKC